MFARAWVLWRSAGVVTLCHAELSQGGRYGHIVKGMSRGLEICNIYTAIRFELNTLGWMDLNTLTLNALLHNVTEHFKLTQPRPSFFMNL